MTIRIADIAKIAGVSSTTVSLVLNGKPCRVSEKTKERIINIANEYNYVPNSQAQSLVTNRTNIIGVILPNINNPFFAQLATIIEELLLEMGYTAMIVTTRERSDYERTIVTRFISYNVDGLILVQGNPAKTSAIDIQKLISAHKIPTILVDRYNISGIFNQSYSDNELGGYMATKHLISLGHRKIVAMMANQTLYNSIYRYQGYLRAINEGGIHSHPYFESEINFNSGYRDANSVLESFDFTAVFCCNDTMAYGFIKRVRELGFRVPEDISVVGYDNVELNSYMDVKLTTIDQNVELLAKRTVVMLIEKISNRVESSRIYDKVVKPKLIIGDTTSEINSAQTN